MEWKVTKVYNADTERQQLNAVLKDIRATVVSATATTSTGSTSTNIQDTVGKMVVGDVQTGLSVTYDFSKKVLDFAITAFTISLVGDVTGSATYNGMGGVTILTAIDPSKVGIGEAPIDNQNYVRWNAQWKSLTSSGASSDSRRLAFIGL